MKVCLTKKEFLMEELTENHTEYYSYTEITDVDMEHHKSSQGVIPMWEQLGLIREENNNPNDIRYWKNIIQGLQTY